MDPKMGVRRTRVLWLIKGLGAGGAEQLLLQHAAQRDRDRFDYHVAFVVPYKNAWVPSLEQLGLSVTCLDTAGALDLRWVARLRRLLVDLRPDVVHSHSPLLAVAARLAARTLRPRPALISTEHNRWGRHTTATRVANRLTHALDDDHVAVSRGVVESMTPAAAARTDVLHHGIDLDGVRAESDRDAVRAELGIENHEFVVGTIANYRREKDYPNLFDTAVKVCAAHDEVRFVAVGQGVALVDEIAALHRASGLGERFVLTDYRPDARRVASGFDLFVLASYHEGLPVAVMEALALGLPVVATDVGGLNEAIIDGQEGRLVPPRDPAALADAVSEVVRDRDLRARMAAAALARAATFEVTSAVRDLEARYARLVLASGGTRSTRAGRALGGHD